LHTPSPVGLNGEENVEGRTEKKLLLAVDANGTQWLLDQDAIIGFAPSEDLKSTVIMTSGGVLFQLRQVITDIFPQYPMPKGEPKLIVPTLIDTKTVADTKE
jgi:hypothetical protein